MIEFDYRQERLRTGETICRPVAKVYLHRSAKDKEQRFYLLGAHEKQRGNPLAKDKLGKRLKRMFCPQRQIIC
jgi:hypothetical protein